MNWYVIVFIIALILGIAGMSLGYLKGISKAFHNNQPASTTQASSASLQDKQKEQAETTEEQRRAYMENIKQKMRDNQRR